MKKVSYSWSSQYSNKRCPGISPSAGSTMAIQYSGIFFTQSHRESGFCSRLVQTQVSVYSSLMHVSENQIFHMIRFILLNYPVQYQVSRGKFVGPCSWNKRQYWLLCQGHFPFVFSKKQQQRQHYCSHYTHAFFWMHEYQGIDHWNMYQSQNLKQDCWQCATKKISS